MTPCLQSPQKFEHTTLSSYWKKSLILKFYFENNKICLIILHCNSISIALETNTIHTHTHSHTHTHIYIYIYIYTNIYIYIYIFIYMCVCVCVCVRIVIHRETVSLYHNSSVWLDTKDAWSETCPTIRQT